MLVVTSSRVYGYVFSQQTELVYFGNPDCFCKGEWNEDLCGKKDFYDKLLKKEADVIQRYESIITPKTFIGKLKLIMNEDRLQKIMAAQQALESKKAIKEKNTIDDKLL